MNKEIMEKIKGLTPEHYINTTEVINVGGVSLTVWDVMVAAQIRKLNVFLGGDTGEGKTQLEKDILGLYGNNGTFLLGRDDMKVRDLFMKLSGKNYKKFQEGEIDSDQIAQLTDAVGKNIFVVDELTRCIPAVQNQLFNLFDGYIEINGVQHSLGSGFNVGVASGNWGNGKYVGTSAQDRALLDRMHILLDVDNFVPGPNNFKKILESTNDPRVKDAVGKDRSQDIIEIYNSVSADFETSSEEVIAALYLRYGLDYLESTAKHSKRHAKNIWPNIPNMSDSDKAEGGDMIYPISPRAAITYLELAKGLRAIALAKGGTELEEDEKADLVFDTFKIAGAYSGILNFDRIRMMDEYEGNPYTALDNMVENYKTSYGEQTDVIFGGYAIAMKGKTDSGIESKLTGSWAFMNELIKAFADKHLSLEQAVKGGPE